MLSNLIAAAAGDSFVLPVWTALSRLTESAGAMHLVPSHLFVRVLI